MLPLFVIVPVETKFNKNTKSNFKKSYIYAKKLSLLFTKLRLDIAQGLEYEVPNKNLTH